MEILVKKKEFGVIRVLTSRCSLLPIRWMGFVWFQFSSVQSHLFLKKAD